MIKLTLKGAPISTQNAYRYSCAGKFPRIYITKQGRELRDAWTIQAKVQHGEPITERCAVHFTFFFSDKRKRDLSGHVKLVEDSLNGVVWQDDSQIDKLVIERGYDKNEPRVEVVVHIL